MNKIHHVMDWISRHKWGIIVTLVALIVRTWNIDKFPMEFTPDEAALGYNAYSLIKTGHDENGQFFPIIFKSFGDYKPGLYIYLTIPWILIGDLTISMVRMTSAISVTLAVFFTYIILRLIKNELPYAFLKKRLPIYGALILALNPWHILFSRGAWESNVNLTMILFSIVCVLYAVKRGYSHMIVLAGLISGLTLSMYQGAKMSTPLVGLAFIIAYYQSIKRRLSLGYVILALLVAIAVSMPIAQSFLDGRTGRLSVFSILNYQRPSEYIQENILTPTNWTNNDWQFKIFEGEWLEKTRNVYQRYGSALSPRFLFIEGDWEHSHMATPYHGMFYWLDSIFLIIGILTAIRIQSRFWRFVLIWLLLAPLPAALSRDPVNAVRSLPLIAPLTMLIGLGYCQTIRLIKLNYPKLYYPSIAVFIIIQLILFTYFADLQTKVRPMKLSFNNYFGYQQLVEATKKYSSQNIPIVMSQSYDQPYIYFLFFNKIDPVFTQNNINRIDNEYGDVGLVSSVGQNFQFRDIYWDADKMTKNTVFIGNPVTTIHPSSSDEKMYDVSEIKAPSGESIFRIVYTI